MCTRQQIVNIALSQNYNDEMVAMINNSGYDLWPDGGPFFIKNKIEVDQKQIENIGNCNFLKCGYGILQPENNDIQEIL
jgi:hypothetical protein